MLKITSRRWNVESGPNMTPLVDVVMVILIFLMLAGTLGHPQFLLAKAPAIGAGTRLADARALVLDVIVSPTSDGGLIIHAGKITARDADVLSDEMRSARADYQKAGSDPSKIQVVIHPGRNVKYEQIIKIYEAVLKAGYSTVAFAKSRE